MAHTRTVLTDPVNKGTTPVLTATFSNGSTPVSPETAVLRLYDHRTNEVINSRSAFDLMPFVTGSALSWPMEIADTPIVNADSGLEVHVARLTFTWNSGLRKGIHEIEHLVVNLS